MKFIARYLLLLVILNTLLISSINVYALPYEKYTKNNIENLAFKQEINIPIDTNLPEAKYQPIDIRIIFTEQCYAKDVNDHSIRICIEKGSEITELESQIYNLEKIDDTHISSCGVVFLIPEIADGTEKYFVLYDSAQTDSPNYEKHVFMDDSHYFYEPIPGQKIDVDYFGIKEKDDYIYAIVQKGELLGNPVSQSILKFKPGSKVVETYNIEQLCVFDMRYGIFAQPDYVGSSWATSVKKTVLAEGNLMIRVRIECTSPKGDILTDNIYTYYNSPVDTKRIFVDVYHEVLEDITVEEPSLLDGTYGGIVTIKSRSSTIEKMNVGEILPKIHVFTESGNIEEYPVPQNPSSIDAEVIIGTKDDIDLGKNAWISLSDPSTNIAHGLILNSNTNLNSEEDGVQVKAWVKENVKLPGLEADTGSLYIARNSYENNNHNPNLKKGFNVNFKAEFVTYANQGFESIDKESIVFQKLESIRPILRENISQEEKEETPRFSLSTYVHIAPSIALGSLLSAATGKKFPYIYAELYKNNSFKSSGSVSRLALGSMDFDLEGKSFFEKIKTVFGIFDIKNSSFFKKIVFPDLEPGIYVIKIFRENTIFGDESKFIGYGIADVSDDTNIRIFCSSQGTCNFNVFDQDEKGVEGVKFYLLQDNAVITDGISDFNGSIVLKAPTSIRDSYTLRVLYKGFLVDEQEIHLRLLNHFKIYMDSFYVNLYDLNVRLIDKWNQIPEVEVNLVLTSKDMFEPITISAKKEAFDKYIFKNLPEADYVLNLKYKSFELKENIKLEGDKTIELVLPAEYTVSLNIMNNIGMSIDTGTVVISRNNKDIKVDIDKNGKSVFTVPPGAYNLKILVDDETVAMQGLDIRNDKTLDVVTKQGSFIHTFVFLITIISVVGIFVYMFLKRKLNLCLKLFVVVLLFISIFQPWWILNGEEKDIHTNTINMLYPPKMITLTSSSDVIGGSISVINDDFTTVMVLLSGLIVFSIILILLSLFIKERFSKSRKATFFAVILILIVCIGLFYYAMSMVTNIGVGGFIGSGDISVSIPGRIQSVNLACSWGPGIGFILVVVSLTVLFLSIFIKKK
ncbi:MAG: hypothetical protein MUO82_04975 [Candidatus Thermoplasmatota archaeon]|nr:hypothetical protein [Candidatus Thermoplasmatota archaeon]